MPIHEGITLSGRTYYQYGKQKKYYYATEKGKKLAYDKACKQAIAIKLSERRAKYGKIIDEFKGGRVPAYNPTPKFMEYVNEDPEIGAGLKDFINGVWQALKGNRKNFPPSSRKVLEQYGNIPIEKMYVARKPLSQKFQVALKALSFLSGKEPSHDQLFHLFLVCELPDGVRIRVEKNQTLNVEPYEGAILEESVEVPMGDKKSKLTINQMLEKTKNAIGEYDFFIYNGFNGQQNCQNFVLNNLKSNGIEVPKELHDFILQPVSGLVSHWAKEIAFIATSLASRGNLVLEGEGEGEEGGITGPKWTYDPSVPKPTKIVDHGSYQTLE